jgi:hypothetical protein
MRQLSCSAMLFVMAAGCAAPTAPQGADEKSIDSKSDKVIVPKWWAGDGSACGTTLDHDRTFWPPQTILPAGEGEWGAVAESPYGRPGCEWAQIIDYQIPMNWWAMNWQWAWIHIAPRNDVSTQQLCEATWTNMRIYTYPHHGAGNDGFLALEESRKGNWNAIFQSCDFDQPFDHWVDPVWDKMIRVVSQSGVSIVPQQPHYSYFVTH